jgi:pimeloyl-ACP methyl ester carboxylesterase
VDHQVVDTSHGEIAFVDTKGEGHPVVMIHANSMCKESFVPQIAALRETRRVIAFDLPGHGRSSNAINPRRTYSITGYAEALTEALERIGIQRFVTIGHSLGGHVALEIVAQGAPCKGAIVFGTPPIVNSLEGLQAGFKPSPEMAYTGNPELTEEQVKMVVALALGSDVERKDFFLQAVRRSHGLARQYMMEAAMAGQGSDQRRLVETSPIPLAIVNGENDPVINLDYIDTLSYANLWGGRPIRLVGAGHGLHRERTADFNTIIRRFLADVW